MLVVVKYLKYAEKEREERGESDSKPAVEVET